MKSSHSIKQYNVLGFLPSRYKLCIGNRLIAISKADLRENKRKLLSSLYEKKHCTSDKIKTNIEPKKRRVRINLMVPKKTSINEEKTKCTQGTMTTFNTWHVEKIHKEIPKATLVLNDSHKVSEFLYRNNHLINKASTLYTIKRTITPKSRSNFTVLNLSMNTNLASQPYNSAFPNRYPSTALLNLQRSPTKAPQPLKEPKNDLDLVVTPTKRICTMIGRNYSSAYKLQRSPNTCVNIIKIKEEMVKRRLKKMNVTPLKIRRMNKTMRVCLNNTKIFSTLKGNIYYLA